MTEKAPVLHLVQPAARITDESLLNDIHNFIHDNLLDLDGDPEADVVLEQARSDERKLGKLNSFERRAFVLTALLEQTLNDTLIDIEANSAERVAAIMRERKIGYMQAAHVFMQEHSVPEDRRLYINMCGMTHTNLVTLYDWSVRRRFNDWKSMLIVREGYVVHSYG